MTRIGVISDTHLADTGAALDFLREVAGRHFQGVELIVHAGDVVAPGVLAAFAPCPVFAVRGNMDPANPDMPIKRVIEVEDCRIGLMHGWGPRDGLVKRILNEFGDSSLDCLIYGHSHVPMCEWSDGMFLFNPGSATDRRGMPYASVGMLEVDGGVIEGRIIPLDVEY